MSIDLATFNNNLGRDIVQEYLETNFDDFNKLPPRLILDRGMQYVDMYIKIYYFPQEVSWKWYCKGIIINLIFEFRMVFKLMTFKYFITF